MMEQITFDEFESGIKVIRGSKKNPINADETTEVSFAWEFGNIDGICKSVETKEDTEETKDEDTTTGVAEVVKKEEVISIPRGKPESFLSSAIRNKGNYFAERNRELVTAEAKPYFLKPNIMTQAEQKLFTIMDTCINKMLRNINCEVVIFPKVRLADIVDVQEALRPRKSYFYAIAQKHVDYILYDKKSLNLICAVELDDLYHTRVDRKARDNFVDDTLRSCGVTIFRINTPIKDVNEGILTPLIDYVLDFYTPVCPECGSMMELKRSKNSRNYGHRFYGCLNWKPNRAGCNKTIDID